MLRSKPEHIESHDRILHGRVNGAETIGALETLEHPLTAFLHSPPPDCSRAVLFPKLQQLINAEEEVMHGEELLVAAQRERPARDIKFFKREPVGNGFLR